MKALLLAILLALPFTASAVSYEGDTEFDFDEGRTILAESMYEVCVSSAKESGITENISGPCACFGSHFLSLSDESTFYVFFSIELGFSAYDTVPEFRQLVDLAANECLTLPKE